jgi:pyruvate/2-oxoglutarate dehydrogenase complex dihydrolipoamide dehydrogenase (E3) component
MGRALLADPYLPRKALEGRDDEIVRCCRCFTCMAERLITGLRICALNPVIGSEYEHNFAPASAKPKKVLVAGGGPGGIQCALTAAECGHEVILCEKSDSLGGALKAERGVSIKADLYKYIAVKTKQLEKAGVDIRLNTEATPGLAAQIAPDALIIAAGSSPLVPAIGGIDKAVMADDLPDYRESLGHEVVILGGGLVGCETAVELARAGKSVTVIEMKSDLCTDANPRHRPLLLAELGKNVKCLNDHRAVRSEKDAVICEKCTGETPAGEGEACNGEVRTGEARIAGSHACEIRVPADSVICAAGRVANSAVVSALRDCAPYVDAIGDCVKPANVTQAVFRGHYSALDI